MGSPLEYRACASIDICNVTGVVIDALFLEFEINEFILLVIPGDIKPLVLNFGLRVHW